MKKSLKRIRSILGLTQEQLGRSIGMTSTGYAMMERGEVYVHQRNVMAIECLLWREGLMKHGQTLQIEGGE